MPAKGKGGVSPSLAYEGLPDELADFLSRDTYSLLIKGDSGTGKTTLALTILKALGPIVNLLYISTRTSPLQMMENHPWAEEVFGPASALEGERSESEGWETLVDSRLDEPNVIFERITNVLMDKQAPTVVIDSWESLSDTLGSEALRTNIKVLQTWRERAGARFILVGEDPSNTAIDFLVEGVVVLKEKSSEGRRLREIALSKLHGVQILRAAYFFTLEEGVFRSFPSHTPRAYAFHNPLPVKFDRPFRRTRGRYPSGYEPLDRLLDGGYPAKSVALVELGERVDSRVGLTFVSKMVQDWLAAGDHVLLQRPGDVEPRFMNQYVKSFGAGGKGRLDVVGPGSRLTAPETPEAGRARGRRGAKRKVLEILSESPGRQQADAEERIGLKGSGADVTILFARPSASTAEGRRGVSTHLRFVQIEGTLFAESLLPWSSLYAVVPGATAGNPMMTLEPVV